jgi:cytochrome P450
MSLPNGPKAPTIAQLVNWIVDPTGYMEAATRRYGDIFAATALSGDRQKPAIFVSNPQGLQHLLSRDRGLEFSAPGEANRILQPIVGPRSLFMLSGDRHLRERKLLMPPFHGDRMKSYGEVIGEIGDRVMATLPVNQTFRARHIMQDITLQIIMQVVFGLQEGERYEQLKPLLAQLTELTNSPLRSSILFFRFLQHDWGAWSPWGRMMRSLRRIDELFYAEIEDRRQQNQGDREDILSLLLSARMENGEGMTNAELRDELITLLLAGHETTASAIAWALYWIHRDPQILSQLRAELDELGQNPDPMAVYQLPYLTAVCNETLRIYPVGMLTFFRKTTQPVNFMGYDLVPDTPIVGSIYLTHRRPDLYPEPERFKPERFIERQYSPYEFIPFGAGSRRCLGAALAQYEMKLIVARIVSRYALQLCENRPVRPQRRGITLAPATGIRMKVTAVREQPARATRLTV